ncbi:MAG: zinc ABC transporter solute-binding protein [Clostridiales bacterium]|nr:zinc ABC transporter solute-binding protein [Clostridiales bacterium]
MIYNGLGLDDWAAELGGAKSFAVTSLMSEFIPGDPHVWLSPAYAEAMAGAVCQKLKEFDPAGADIYEENCAVFRGELKALSDEFHPQFAKARLSTFVTGHAALGYLAKEFGLVQKSVSDVFSSSEPAAQQLMELADFCNENGVKYVLSESNAPLAVSETLANECGAQVLPVYMMESAREGGLSFLVRMRHNLETVLKAVM